MQIYGNSFSQFRTGTMGKNLTALFVFMIAFWAMAQGLSAHDDPGSGAEQIDGQPQATAEDVTIKLGGSLLRPAAALKFVDLACGPDCNDSTDFFFYGSLKSQKALNEIGKNIAAWIALDKPQRPQINVRCPAMQRLRSAETGSSCADLMARVDSYLQIQEGHPALKYEIH